MARRRKRVDWDDALWTALSWLGAGAWALVIRPVGRWVGEHSVSALTISAKAVGRGGLTITAGVYFAGRDRAREIGEHGGLAMVDCSCCGQRMSLIAFDQHLADVEAETNPARVEVPAGAQRLAVEGAPSEGLAAHSRPRRRPREWEVECPHCHDWIGPRRLWPVHAEGCNAAAAAKQRRIDAALNWRWHHARDGLDKEELAQVEILRAIDPLPWIDELPVKPAAPKNPAPTGAGVTTKGIDDMQDPRAIIKAADAFADPAINRDNWEAELLEYLRLCAHVEVQLRDRIAEGMVTYMTKAELPHSVVQHIVAVAEDHDHAGVDFLKARKAAEDWIASLRTPFSKVS